MSSDMLKCADSAVPEPSLETRSRNVKPRCRPDPTGSCAVIVKRSLPVRRVDAAHCVRVQWKSRSQHVTDPIPRNVRARVRLLAVRTAEHLARSQQLDAAAHILENYLTVHGAEAPVGRWLHGQ